MKLVFDIEADNLLPKISKFHCAGAIEVETGKEHWFRPHQLNEFLELLDSADTIIAHNAFGYDIPALTKLTGWKPKANVQCTKVMSQVLNYRRFKFGHSLKLWGEFFKDYKGEYLSSFEEFNEDMFKYMQQDVRLGLKVYKYLYKELQQHVKKTQCKFILKALRSEMNMDRIMTEQCENGWKFDKSAAVDLMETIDKKMNIISEFINPKLSATVKIVDPDTKKEHEPITGKRYAIEKKATYTKTGKLSTHLQRWFGLPDSASVDNSPFFRENYGFCRVDFITGDIGNTDTVKRYLYSIGWKPDDWNWKRVGNEFVKVSPKLTNSSLEPLGEVGQSLMEYYTLRSRKSILEGWFEHVDNDSRLHGDVFNIGTPTFRQTHKIIANLPSGKATLGPEIRKLFIAANGYKLVSADSAACQLRLLAHYMKDDKFTDTVLNGDVHQMNAEIIGCSRNQAKRFIFAYLYGAGAQKLSGYIGQSVNEAKSAMKRYKKALPALASLVDRVNNLVEKQGFIPGLDDRKIYLDPSQRHKALNYLIQGSEAVVMKATVDLIDQRLKESNIEFKHLLFYHDEHTVEVKEDQAEDAKLIIMDCFADAPKQYGIDIMTCGDCKIGGDYYEVH